MVISSSDILDSLTHVGSPIIGGVLSRPADQWPDTLGHIPYLKNHPYFLPCFVASLIAFLTFSIALIGLKEVMIISSAIDFH